MQGWQLSGAGVFDFPIVDESGTALGGRNGIPLCVWGFHEPSLIWLIPAWEVTCGICGFLGTLSRVSISSPNVVGANEVHLLLFDVECQPEPSIQSCCPSYLSHGSSQPHLPSLVESILQGSSASVKNIPCDTLPVWKFCPSPNWVCHHRSACPAQDVDHHHPRLPHSPHCRNMQDRSDYFQWHSTSPQMLFQALWLSILPFQHFSYLPAPAQSLSLHLQLALLPQRSLYPHNPRSISPSLHCLQTVFHLISPPRASFWIASNTKHQGIGPVQPPSRSYVHLLDAVHLWIAWLVCRICLPVVAKGSFSERWLLYCVLTSLMGHMLDVARYGPHGVKLRLEGWGWYPWSTSTKQEGHFVHHYIGNSNANCTSLHDI